MDDKKDVISRRDFLNVLGGLVLAETAFGESIRLFNVDNSGQSVPRNQLPAYVSDWRPVNITDYVEKELGIESVELPPGLVESDNTFRPSKYLSQKSIETVISPNGKIWLSDGIIDKKGNVHRVETIVNKYLQTHFDESADLTTLDNLLLYDLVNRRIMLVPSNGFITQRAKDAPEYWKGKRYISKLKSVPLAVSNKGICLYYLYTPGMPQNQASAEGAVFANLSGKAYTINKRHHYGDLWDFRNFQLGRNSKVGGITTESEYVLFDIEKGKISHQEKGALRGISGNGKATIRHVKDHPLPKPPPGPRQIPPSPVPTLEGDVGKAYVISDLRTGFEEALFYTSKGNNPRSNVAREPYFRLSEKGYAILACEWNSGGYWSWQVHLAQRQGFENSDTREREVNIGSVVDVTDTGLIKLGSRAIPFARNQRRKYVNPIGKVEWPGMIR